MHEPEIKGTFFIDSLKIKSEAEFLISSGKFFQSWLAPYATLSRLEFFVLREFLRIKVFCLSLKIVVIISGDRSSKYLWTSIKRNSMHFWWTDFSFALIKAISNSDLKFYCIRHRQHPWILFVLRRERFVQNIHINGQ